MSQARWLGAAAGASWVLMVACGGDTTTNNYGTCGPGTRMDPDLNACVPVEPDGGTSGTGGSAGGATGGAGGGAGASGGASGAGAGAGEGGAAGVGAAAGQDGDAGLDAKPEPHPDDDACLDGVVYVVNGDKACGTYNPAGVCSEAEPEVIELPPLGEEDLTPQDAWDPSTGGVWVRTPSRPGTKLDCGGCSRPGSVAQIRIPIRTDAGYSFPVYVVHEDAENEMAPWYISHERIGLDCYHEFYGSCWVDDGKEQTIVIETADLDAPARNFHIFYYPNLGPCDDFQ